MIEFRNYHQVPAGLGYGWVITADSLFDDDDDDVLPDETGTMGPRNVRLDAEIILNHGAKFRCLDDDGIVYYEGYFLASPDYEADDFGFEPLDDFAQPNAGAVLIEYEITDAAGNPTWEML